MSWASACGSRHHASAGGRIERSVLDVEDLKFLPHGTTFDGDFLALVLASTGVPTWPPHHQSSMR
jgi:hypothetical protein